MGFEKFIAVSYNERGGKYIKAGSQQFEFPGRDVIRIFILCIGQQVSARLFGIHCFHYRKDLLVVGEFLIAFFNVQ
jgi:hypothetical protein